MTRVIKTAVTVIVIVGILTALFHFRDIENFDFDAYDSQEAFALAEGLSSEALLGRGPGEPGNELAVDYITGFLDDNGVDYELQYFTQLTPIIDPNGTITVGDKVYQQYRDFEFTLSGEASGLDFEGELLYVAESFFDIDPELMRDRILVMKSNRLSDDHIQRMIEYGAKGALYYTNEMYFTASWDREIMNRKFVYIDDKTSSQVFIGRISFAMAKEMLALAKEDQYEEYYRPAADISAVLGSYERIVGVVHDVQGHVGVSYRLVEMPNIIINIPGKNRAIANNFITRFDGQGLGNSEIGYFPTALNGGASSAALLELAKALNLQKEIPDEDINIVMVNASTVSEKSFVEVLALLEDRYAGNKNIALEYIGYKDSKGAYIDWDYFNNQAVIIGKKLYSNSIALGAVFEFLEEPIVDFSYYLDYSKMDNPFVMVTGTHNGDVWSLRSSSDDDITQISEESIHNAMKIVLGYVSTDLYKQTPLNFIDIRFLYALIVLAVVGLSIMILRETYELTKHPVLEAVYYSRPYTVVSLTLKYTLPFGLALLLIGMVLNVPPDFNLVQIGGSNLTNFSLYNVIRGTYFSILSIFTTVSQPSSTIMVKLMVYIRKSLILISLGLALSLVFGIFKGILDAYSRKRTSTIKTLTSIAAYSIPDVLIAILSLLAVIYLSRIEWISSWIGPNKLRTVIMPVVALTVIPSIYISRLIFVTIEEEKQKEYVKFLYYKGIPRRLVYLRQFTYISVVKVLSSMKAILMVIFSNLILVEYIFSYPGIMFNIITYQNNPYVIIIFALVIGILFVSLTGLSRLILRLITPRKEAIS